MEPKVSKLIRTGAWPQVVTLTPATTISPRRGLLPPGTRGNCTHGARLAKRLHSRGEGLQARAMPCMAPASSTAASARESGCGSSWRLPRSPVGAAAVLQAGQEGSGRQPPAGYPESGARCLGFPFTINFTAPSQPEFPLRNRS